MISPELIKKVQAKLKTSRASYDYFFDSINDPAWIIPLKEEGLFKNILPAVKQDGYISFPYSSEMHYLLRMADKAPDDVVAVLKEIPETDNQRVQQTYIEILLKIDAAKAVQFTNKVVKFLDAAFLIHIQDLAAKLVIKFAAEDQTKAAFKIAQALLIVKPDPKADSLTGDAALYTFIEPQVKYRDYEYKEIVHEITPALASADPQGAIKFFSKLLYNAIKFKMARSPETDEDEDSWEDYSNIWALDIAGIDNGFAGQPRKSLVAALRDSVIALLGSTLSVTEKVAAVEKVASEKYKVFRRIVEYSLREYKDDPSFKPLYDRLFAEVEPITDPGILKKDPYTFDLSAGISMNELQGLSDEALIEKLRTHKPKNLAFWRDEMGGQVTGLIKSDPTRYLTLAEKFEGLHAQYIHAYFAAAEDMADTLEEREIIVVLKFAEKFLSKTHKPGRYYDWSRMSIARLLHKIVGQREDKREHISADSITITMRLTLKLARDLEPTLKHEEEFGGDNMEPSTLSVNTVRGEAMHALARLILWSARNKPKEDIIGKIYQELDWHLDADNDPSLAIRSIYGQWLPWIWDSNKSWGEKNLRKIFTMDERGDAAWDAYVSLNQVYNNLYALTEPIMRQQIARLEKFNKTPKARRDARSQFVKFLMVYYWRGLNGLSDDSLVKLFFETADVHYRAEAINFVGFELRKAGTGAVDATIKERLADLWDSRLAALSPEAQTNKEELEKFGSWFASGVFDDQQSLTRLLEILALIHSSEPDYMVLEKLSELSSKFPLETIRSLKYMIQGTRERWAVESWRSQVSQIIKTAYASGVTEAKSLAVEQANLLVAKGYHYFRDAIK